MNKEQLRSVVLQSFLERNYHVYLSVLNGDFVIERDGCYGSCYILKTTRSSDGRLILDLRGKDRKSLKHSHYTYVIGVEVNSLEMWLIPVDDIGDNRTLSLTKSKEHYIVREKSLTTSLMIQQVVEKEKEEMNKAAITRQEIKEKTEEQSKKEIENILKRS